MSRKAVGIVALLAALSGLVPAASAQPGPVQACTPMATPAGIVRPERICRSPDELDALLRSTYVGRVVIPRDVQWEMRAGDGRPLGSIPVRSGIELVGQRGDLGSRPLLFTDHRAEGFTLFQVNGSDVRIEGLHLRGPYRPGDRKKALEGVEAISVTQDAGTWPPRDTPARPHRPPDHRGRQRDRGVHGRRRRPRDDLRRRSGVLSRAVRPRARVPVSPVHRRGAREGRAEPPPQQRRERRRLRGRGQRGVLRDDRGERLRVQQPRGRRQRAGLQRLRRALQLRAPGRADLRG